MSSAHNDSSVNSSTSAQELALKLIAWFDSQVFYVVALSGGVDSAVVAKAAAVSGAKCRAVTAKSPSVAAREIEDATGVALAVGIPHEFLATEEYLSPDYQRNDVRRCYHCKSHLFGALHRKYPNAILVTGTNADDLGDYRPGLEAASEANVRAPLAELQIGKNSVRRLAVEWELSIADKPASPCLASRIAFGVEVTPDRLKMIEAAESLLRMHYQLTDCRVRLHQDMLARVEVPLGSLARLAEETVRVQLVDQLRQLGFRYVTLDLGGLKSGSLNPVFQLSGPSN